MKFSKTLTFKITLAGILTALAVISFLLEGLFPPLIIPGARMGISNIFILLAVIFLGNFYGYCVLILKIALGSLLSGNISAIIYSLPAGIISLSLEVTLMYFVSKLSILAISTLGGIVNILTQNVMFCIITNVTQYLIYLPYLALIGSLAGVFVGFCVYLIVRFAPKSIINKI